MLAVALGLGLAGCASSGGDVGNTVGNLLAFNSPSPPPLPPTPSTLKVDCPTVDVQDGTSTVRTYAGADRSNAGVRYQFTISELARECNAANGQIAIRVGVSGRVLLGPSGAPGTFNVPVRIAIRRDSDQQYLVTKLYQVPANVPANDSQTAFTVVSDPLVVPYTREAADQDYSIYVGFDAQGGEKPKRPARRRRG